MSDNNQENDLLADLFFQGACPQDEYGQSLHFMKYQCDFNLACLRTLYSDPFDIIINVDIFQDGHLTTYVAFLTYFNGLLMTLRFMCDVLCYFIFSELKLLMKPQNGLIKYLRDNKAELSKLPLIFSSLKSLNHEMKDLNKYVNYNKHEAQSDFEVVSNGDAVIEYSFMSSPLHGVGQSINKESLEVAETLYNNIINGIRDVLMHTENELNKTTTTKYLVVTREDINNSKLASERFINHFDKFKVTFES